MHTVFVYGTLKRGYGNNRLIEQGGGEFLGEATTVDPMYLCGDGIPFACRMAPTARQAFPIKGEVFRVDAETLCRMDRLEGHPHSYRRTPAQVLLIGESHPLDAELYVMERAKEWSPACPVEGGAYVWGGYSHGDR